jgi:RNA polymerase sigma-70 factor (ECF subfamily)
LITSDQPCESVSTGSSIGRAVGLKKVLEMWHTRVNIHFRAGNRRAETFPVRSSLKTDGLRNEAAGYPDANSFMKSTHSTVPRCGKSRAISVEVRQIVLRPQCSTLALTGAPLDHEAFDADYLARLKHGDPETELHFFSYFSKAIWLKLRNRVRARHLIDEIRQETFARVLGYLQSGKSIQYPERFGGFVQGVCNNVMLEALRSESSHPQGGETPIDPPDHRVKFDTDIVTNERKQAVRELLSEMPEKDRTLLRMVFLEEGERSEICKRFKVDGDYLRVLLHRAKERFRETVRKKGFDAILH